MSGPLARSQFDLDSLPVQEAADELRRLARWSMQQLTATGDQPLPALDFWQRWLSPKASRHWHGKAPRGATWRLRKHQRWADQRATEALSQHSTNIPDMFLAMAAAWAWAHPDFETDAWRFTRRRIETHMIFDRELEQNLAFAQPTFWLLIAIATDVQADRLPPARFWWPPSWQHARNRRILRRLSELGAERSHRRRHWAGFWDQWLIAEVMSSLSEARQQAWMKKRPAIERIPMVRIRLKLMPMRLPSEEEDWDCHRPDWMENAPASLLERYGFRMSPPPLG